MLLNSNLHASLNDPSMHAINFLNEIIGKFPEAISFGPGAPNPEQLRHIDIQKYIERYVQYLCDERGLSLEKAQHLLFQYGPASGIINELIATALEQDQGIRVPADGLVITVGAQEAMLIVLRALFRTSTDRLAIIEPSFVGILGAARLLDIDVIGIRESDQGINLEEIETAFCLAREQERPIRALYVAPDYANPSGTFLTLATRQKLLKLAKQYDVFLLEDNTYGFTAAPENVIPSLKALDETGHVILLGTFAKIGLPGARIGYVVADQLMQNQGVSSHRLANDLATIKSMTTVNTSPICQAIIGGMLLENSGSIAKLERKKAQLYRDNLECLLKSLERHLPIEKAQALGIKWNRPTGGFFVRVRLPIIANMALLESCAENFSVLWTPMSSFYLNQCDNNEIRLSCSYLNSIQIEEGVKRLTAFFESI